MSAPRVTQQEQGRAGLRLSLAWLTCTCLLLTGCACFRSGPEAYQVYRSPDGSLKEKTVCQQSDWGPGFWPWWDEPSMPPDPDPLSEHNRRRTEPSYLHHSK